MQEPGARAGARSQKRSEQRDQQARKILCRLRGGIQSVQSRGRASHASGPYGQPSIQSRGRSPSIRYLRESVKPVWPAVEAQEWVLEVGGVHSKWGHRFTGAGLNA